MKKTGVVIKTIDGKSEKRLAHGMTGSKKLVDDSRRVFNVPAVRDTEGGKTAYAYTESTLLKSVTDPLGNKVSFSYDSQGNLTRCENPNGTSIECAYGEYGSIRSQLCRDAAGKITASYVFDYALRGGLGSVVDDLGRGFCYSYDSDGRLAGSIDTINPMIVGGHEIARAGGGEGWPTILSLAGKEAVSYQCDADGELSTLLLPSDTEIFRVHFSYDDALRRTKITMPGAASSSYAYDEAGRVSSIENRSDGAARSFAYEYDANGNMLRENNARFAYDALNRLIAWHDPSTGRTTTYSYDAAGNLLSLAADGVTLQSFRYDAANRIINEGFSYDTNGNQTANGRYSYSYDPLNRLTKIARDGHVVASYEYDYLGRRILATQGGKTIYFHYDGANLVAESDEAGSVTARYVYDDADRLVSMSRGGRMYFYHFNARGDVVLLTDREGRAVNSYAYDPWGKVIAADEQVENPYRYAGYRYDETTGLYYLFQRYYDPQTARFLSKDALFVALVRDAVSHNAYTYAFNNPTTYVDPYGAWGSKIHKDVTEECAKQLGYAPEDIEAIARAAVDTDTSPGNCYSDVPGKHINKHWLGWLGVRLPDQLKYANEEFARAKELQTTDKQQSLQHLGQGLHSLQDYYAHGTLPPYGWHTLGPWNGLMPWYSADDPDSALNRRRAQKVAEATKEYLEDYLA